LPNDRFIEQFCSIVCPLSTTSCFDGIISYLTHECGGHVMDRNVVSITASGEAQPQNYPLRNVAAFENRTMFLPQNEANSWVCYDFKEKQITLVRQTMFNHRS
jgi:hypothetical protein